MTNPIGNAIANYLRPEYVFHPSQVWKRVKQRVKPPHVGEFDHVMLPWKLPLRVRSLDFIGLHIRWFGAFDLCVSEAIWRLLEPGDRAIDVGANMGYMTSLMAARVGDLGQVIAAEPHPELYQELLTNCQLWQDNGISNVHAQNIALGDHTGEAVLTIPSDFTVNRGLASLSTADPSSTTDPGASGVVVSLQRLDTLVNDPVGLLKVDVEGNELPVLIGAGDLIRQHQIRDIVFEDFGDYPTPVSQFLEDQGYTLFYLGKRFLGPVVGAIQNKQRDYKIPTPEGPSYLATIAPDRAIARLKPWGWGIFGVGAV